jgi:hypothetical protein
MSLLLALSFAVFGADSVRFPTLTSDNLERQAFTLPADFGGERNVVFVAFKREQQTEVDSWLPHVQGLLARIPGTEYYELPTIGRMVGLIRGYIDRGMARGITSRAARERTITLYIDKGPFKEALGIDSEQAIQILVVDRAGVVHWRSTGSFTSAKARGLDSALAAR